MSRKLADLTPQHVQILRLAGEGLMVAAIARRLWLTESTVKYHRTRLMRLLGARNIEHAYTLAYRRGLLKGA